MNETGLPSQDITEIDSSNLDEVKELVKDVSKRLDGVTILRKGEVDVMSDGRDVTYCALPGTGRRCGGQVSLRNMRPDYDCYKGFDLRLGDFLSRETCWQVP